MKGIFDFLRLLYKSNKKLFIMAVLVILAFLVIGCTTGGAGSPPPSGPVGGGC